MQAEETVSFSGCHLYYVVTKLPLLLCVSSPEVISVFCALCVVHEQCGNWHRCCRRHRRHRRHRRRRRGVPETVTCHTWHWSCHRYSRRRRRRRVPETVKSQIQCVQ